MTRFSALLALCAGALTTNVVASPTVIRESLVTLPLARRLNATGVRNIVARDQARAKVLKTRGNVGNSKTGPIDDPLDDVVVSYTVDVKVGTPPITYTLIVDTGSSNTWVGANQSYVATNSSVDTGDSVFVEYGSGGFVGEEYTDTVAVGKLTIANQSIGGAYLAYGFSGVDGILGLGPTDLTNGTTSGGGTVPTVLDNAVTLGVVKEKTLGISFEPSTGDGTASNGELTFGGTDSTKFTGKLDYVPFTSTSPASEYVGIDQSITYGSGGQTILASTAGIVDTGTTLIMIASDAFSTYTKATGGTADKATGLLKITQEQYNNLQSLFFHIGKNTFELTPNAQIWPRALNTAIGGQDGNIYLVVADVGSNSGSGLDFIDGFTFLQRFYHAVDYAGGRAGFATTSFTHASTN
ncbi:family A1 protease [Dichomitus squalens]|uniref:Family A1 protease n=1 Tax=Dichomitus squalens TaxID=114155 RepID=A0A4Q9NME2_9APHY|nr:family A1 protease [Dichomitus squalens LYAD-421 SS1]EJF65511.1 family A1 protease [Dichomitus squalens LYAD-421 SS1]TBU33652.1 family A1 protease [Dichomitus squalens]TBU41767.1 family A1 protease [Dichomitus squalens]